MGTAVSDPAMVTSGVPQGSVLGPLLFVVYINDMPGILKNRTQLFADDSKILAEVSTEEQIKGLQEDLDLISEWSSRWLLKLNTAKCKVMHIGCQNKKSEYRLNDPLTGFTSKLEITSSERDLGIQVNDSLKFSEHIRNSAAKASSMLGMMRRTFVYRNELMWKKLYTTYIRPHLEYAVQVWNPHLKGDIECLEKVQRRATKVSESLKHLTYEERLKRLNLTTLEDRRTRGDMIEMFKLTKKLETVNWHVEPNTFVPRDNHRGHSDRVQYRGDNLIRCQPRFNFFTNRVAKNWNMLPDEVTSAPDVNNFKGRIDQWTKDNDITWLRNHE
jgi:ribonuclease P/MRP protein subunit RPP40